MCSDEITVRNETIPNDTGKSARLFAYSRTLFEKARHASPSSGDKAKSEFGLTGLKKEPGKTRFGTCNDA